MSTTKPYAPAPSFVELRNASRDHLRRLMYQILIDHNLTWDDFKKGHDIHYGAYIRPEQLSTHCRSMVKGMIGHQITWRHFANVIQNVFGLDFEDLRAVTVFPTKSSVLSVSNTMNVP